MVDTINTCATAKKLACHKKETKFLFEISGDSVTYQVSYLLISLFLEIIDAAYLECSRTDYWGLFFYGLKSENFSHYVFSFK